MRLGDSWDDAFHVWCRCGHVAALRWDAIGRPELTQSEAMARLRCSRCRRWGYEHICIGWVEPCAED